MLRSAIIASVHRNSSTGRMRTIALLIVAFIILVGIVIHGLRRLIPTPKEIAMVLSAQLEQSMGTKVHIGRVTGNVMTGITLEDVALGDEPLSPTGAFFVTKAMKLKLRTSAVLLRRRPYTDIVKEVHIYQPVIFVARDAQGRLNITRIFKPRRPPRPPRWRLRVYLHNARIIYRDEMLTISDGKPLYLDLIPITGDVRVRGINGTSFTISGRVRDQLLRQVRIDGWQKPDGTYELNAQVHIRNLTSAQLPASVMRTVERYVNLRSGAMSANVKLKLRRYAPERPVELSLRGTFQLAHAKVIPQQALRGAIHTPKITGSLKLTMTGKQMTKLELQAHTPTPIRRLGKLALQLNLTPPHLYTRLRLSDSHLTEWKRLLPMLQRLPQGLDIRSGIADVVNVTLERRGKGKPLRVDGEAIARHIRMTAHILRRPIRLATACFTWHLSLHDGKPVGRIIVNGQLPSNRLSRTPGATVAANVTLERNRSIDANVRVAGLPARLLNLIQLEAAPYVARFLGGFLNIAFALRLHPGSKQSWTDARIELRNIRISQLSVPKVRNWERAFPMGMDVRNLSGALRRTDGLWEFSNLGLKWQRMKVVVDGALAQQPFAFQAHMRAFDIEWQPLWRLIRAFLPKTNALQQVEVMARSEGMLRATVMGTQEEFSSALDVQIPTLALRHAKYGTMEIEPMRAVLELAHAKNARNLAGQVIMRASIPVTRLNLRGLRITTADDVGSASPLRITGLVEITDGAVVLGERLSATCRVRVTAAQVRGLPIREMRLVANLSERRIELTNVTAQIGSGWLHNGTMVVKLPKKLAKGALPPFEFYGQVQGVKLSDLQGMLKDTLPTLSLTGTATGKIAVRSASDKIIASLNQDMRAVEVRYRSTQLASKSRKSQVNADVESNLNSSAKGTLREVTITANQLRIHLRISIEHTDKGKWQLATATGAVSISDGSVAGLLNNQRHIDAPIKSLYALLDVNDRRYRFTSVQCTIWQSKLRGWLSVDRTTQALNGYALISEMNLTHLAELLGEDVRGRVDGQFTFSGKLNEPTVMAEVYLASARWNMRMKGSGREVNEADAPSVESARTKPLVVKIPYGRFNLKWTPASVELMDSQLRYAGARIRMQGKLDELTKGLENARVDLKLNIRRADVRAIATQFNVPMKVDGIAAVDMAVRGSVRTPKIDVAITMALPEVYGLVFDRMDAKLSYDHALQRARIDSLKLSMGSGRFNAIGSISDLSEEQTINIRFELKGLQLGRLVRPLLPELRICGKVTTADGTITGTLRAPIVQARMAATEVALDGVQLGRATAQVVYKHGAKRTTAKRPAGDVRYSLELVPPEGRITASGSIAIAKPSIVRMEGEIEPLQLTWLERLMVTMQRLIKAHKIKIPQLERAIVAYRRLPHPVEGTVRGTFSCYGRTTELNWRIATSVEDLRLAMSLPYQIRARMRGNGQIIRVEDLRLVHRAGTLVVSGSIERGGKLNIDVGLERFSTDALSPWMPAGVPVHAIASAKVHIGGSINEPEVSMQAEISPLQRGALIIERLILKQCTYRDGKLSIERGNLLIHQAGQTIAIWGVVPLHIKPPILPPDEPLEVHLQLAEAPLTFLRSFLVPIDEGTQGKLDVNLQLTGTWRHPGMQGYVALQAPVLRFTNAKMVLHDVDVAIRATNNRAVIERAAIGYNSGQVAMKGYVELGANGLTSPSANNFDVTVSAHSLPAKLGDMLNLGKLNATIALRNLPKDAGPKIELVSLSLTEQPEALKGSGWIVWMRDVWAQWSNFRLPRLLSNIAAARCNMRVTLNRLRITAPRAFDGHITGNVELVNRPQQGGQYKVLMTSLTNPDKRPVGKGSESIVEMPLEVPTIVGALTIHDATVRGVPRTQGARGKAIATLPPLPAFDIRIKLGNNVRMDNMQLKAPLGGQVVIGGRLDALKVDGRLYAERGTLRLPGARLHLTVAEIRIAVVPGIKPGTLQTSVYLDVEARGRMGRYDVTVRMSGPLDTSAVRERRMARMQFTSTPPLPEDEIARRLLGLSATELTGAEGTQGWLQAARERLVPTLQQAFLAAVGTGLAKAFKLEEIGIEREKITGRQRLSIGARISPNLYILWYQGLSGQGAAFEVQYWLNRWVSFGWKRDERERTEFRVQAHFQF